jgi:hypothetical protein
MKKNSRAINKLRIMASLSILCIIFSLSSCLKNGKYYTDFASGGASVDLPLAATNANNPVTFAFDATVTSTDIPFYINLASPKVLGTAVTATFALDSAYLDTYNTNNGTNYQLMPDTVYTIVNGWNRTIPAGKRLDSMYVHFDFTKLDLTQVYILPVTIQSASVPIEQWNHLMISPSVKNQYDGNYSITGYTLRAGDPVRTGEIPAGTMGLATSGPASVVFVSLQPWADGSGVGIGNPNLAINVADSVTITSPGGAMNYSGYSPYYDPATKTFYISYTWGAGVASRLATDTLTYLGPR